MERDGLLSVEGDRHLELTTEGRRQATSVMRKHRLAECLLIDVIGMEWEEVHIEACRWEHVMSDSVERRIAALLGAPTACPHGNPIPGLDELGELPTRSEGIGTLLTLLIGGACAAASNALALTTKSEDVMAPVINMVMMPVLLLSGILLPMTIGPKWLETASAFMPIRHVVDGVRDSFGGDYGSSGLLWGTVWAVVLFGLAVWWGTATFRKENS